MRQRLIGMMLERYYRELQAKGILFPSTTGSAGHNWALKSSPVTDDNYSSTFLQVCTTIRKLQGEMRKFEGLKELFCFSVA